VSEFLGLADDEANFDVVKLVMEDNIRSLASVGGLQRELGSDNPIVERR
jgi:hypothetical protein